MNLELQFRIYTLKKLRHASLGLKPRFFGYFAQEIILLGYRGFFTIFILFLKERFLKMNNE